MSDQADRLIMLDDLFIDEVRDSILDAIGVIGDAYYKHSPRTCKSCNTKKIEPLEVLGAGDKPLFWECQSCDYLHLLRSRVETEALLSPAYGVWTDPNAWGWKDKVDFN